MQNDNTQGSSKNNYYTLGGYLTDFGPNPYKVDLNRATLGNNTYRTALWTGKYLQVTMMSIPSGKEIGLEVHPETDQILRIEQGSGLVQMGNAQNNLYYQQMVFEDDVIFVPAGTWHNIINTDTVPMKLNTVYAPPHHPWGDITPTHESTKNLH